jgi:phospholipid transport system transporter-binding protein
MRFENNTLFISGDLTHAEAPAVLREALRQLGGVRMLDFSGVGKLDSSALALLLELKRRASGGLAVQGLPESLTRLAALYGLESFTQ